MRRVGMEGREAAGTRNCSGLQLPNPGMICTGGVGKQERWPSGSDRPLHKDAIFN